MSDDTTQISPADDTGNPFYDLFRAVADIPMVLLTGTSIYDEPGDDR